MAVIAESVEAGDTTFTVDATTGCADGDMVVLRLGGVDDPPEPVWWCFVVSIDAGPGVVVLTHGQNVQGRNLHVKRSNRPIGGHAAYGRGLTISGQGCTFDDVRIEEFETVAVFVEHHSTQVRIRNLTVVNSHPTRDATTFPLLHHSFESDMRVEGFSYEGYGGSRLFNDENPDAAHDFQDVVQDLYIRPVPRGGGSPLPAYPGVFAVRDMAANVRHDRAFDEGEAGFRVYRFSAPRAWGKAIAIPVDDTIQVPLPDGLLRRGRLYLSATTEALENVDLVNSGFELPLDLLVNAIAGETVELRWEATLLGQTGTTVGYAEQALDEGEPLPRYLEIVTSDEMPAGEFLVLQLEYFPYQDPEGSRDDHDGGWIQDPTAIESPWTTARDDTAWTGGNVSMTSGSPSDWLPVNDGNDDFAVAIEAVPGEILLFTPSFRVGPATSPVSFDVECEESGNRWSGGTTSSHDGFMGWRVLGASSATRPVTGGVTYQVQPGDIGADGKVSLRLLFKLDTASASRNIVATTQYPALISVGSLGLPRVT